MMSVTQEFQTNVLYPGGSGGCGIGTHDPYPDGIPLYDPWGTPKESRNIFKVNLPAATVWNYIWNLEQWSTLFSVDSYVNEDDDGTPKPMGIAVSVDGQFHYFIGGAWQEPSKPVRDVRYELMGFVLVGEPINRICSKGRESFILHEHEDVSETYDKWRSILLPNARLTDANVLGYRLGDERGPPFSVNLEIRDDGNTLVGNAELSLSSMKAGAREDMSYYNAAVTPMYIRILGDGTFDVYLDVKFEFSPAKNGAKQILSNNNINNPLKNNNDGRVNAAGSVTPVAMNLLGVSVPAFLYHRGLLNLFHDVRKYEYMPTTFTSFDLNYTITPTTLYTYP